MPTRVLSKEEADKLGLMPRGDNPGEKAKRVNPHVQEIMDAVKATRPGQYVLYEPADKRGYQSQVLRVRQAFNLLGKPWPLTAPHQKGAACAMKILSRSESFERYPQQPLAKAQAGEEAPAEPEAKKAAKRGPRKRARK